MFFSYAGIGGLLLIIFGGIYFLLLALGRVKYEIPVWLILIMIIFGAALLEIASKVGP